MATQHSSGNEWHTQLGTWLGAVALGLALYALLRDNPNTQKKPDSSVVELAAEIELRNTVVKLQESMSSGSDAEGNKGSTARAWIYFQSAQELLRQEKVEPSLSACLVLANFCYSHADVEQGNKFIDKAAAKIESESSPVTQALAYAAMGHFMFEHAPKTSLETGRERYVKAVSESQALNSDGSLFVQLSILQEWALDEFGAGNEAAGDEQLAAARNLLEREAFTPSYRTNWEQALEAAVIHAKVRGGIL